MKGKIDIPVDTLKKALELLVQGHTPGSPIVFTYVSPEPIPCIVVEESEICGRRACVTHPLDENVLQKLTCQILIEEETTHGFPTGQFVITSKGQQLLTELKSGW